MNDIVSLLSGKEMPGREAVLDLPALNESQDFEVVRLHLVNLIPLLPKGV
jgi:hypothetical protein